MESKSRHLNEFTLINTGQIGAETTKAISRSLKMCLKQKNLIAIQAEYEALGRRVGRITARKTLSFLGSVEVRTTLCLVYNCYQTI